MKLVIKKVKGVLWKIINNLPFKLRYLIIFRVGKKRWPRIRRPIDYCDFIFKDNFYGNHNKRAFLADKLEVRKFVEERGLGNILVNLIGFWDSALKINFDELPNQFAIKCNHSCGMNIICYDKAQLDIEQTRKQLDVWLQTKHPVFFEQHYNYIKPMIVCEALIENDKDGCFPMDYKIHCAHGKPIFIQCCFERTDDDAGRRVIYDTNWVRQDYILKDEHFSEKDLPKPKHLDDMLDYARILSADLDYARVDFYDTDERVIFGEITLTPMGGWLSYFKQEALDLMGDEIRNNK